MRSKTSRLKIEEYTVPLKNRRHEYRGRETAEVEESVLAPEGHGRGKSLWNRSVKTIPSVPPQLLACLGHSSEYLLLPNLT